MSNPVHRFSIDKHSIKTSVLRLPVLWESWVRSSLWQKAIVQGLVLTSPLWGFTRPGLAAPTPPGTIDNTATGSFIDTATDNPVNIFSNTVTVTVVEVAGITATFDSVREATVTEAGANAGPYQGFDGINEGDIAYFDFVITNVGNDPTAFFIPAAPSSLTGATFNAGTFPIQIIAVDPDGAGTDYAPITDLDGSGGPVNVTAAGTTTNLLGASNGYIPADGTVTVRVPVTIIESIVGNPINVVLGETASIGLQNQDYSADTNDLYTSDLTNPPATTNPYSSTTPGSPLNTSETVGAPPNEKEASAQGSVNLAAAYQLQGFKSVALTADADSSGSITEGDTVTWTIFYVNTGTGNITNLNITDALGSPGNGLTYVPSSLAVQTGNTSVFPTALSVGGSPAPNTTYDGDTIIGAATDDDVFSGTLPTLAPNEIIQVGIQATIDDRTPDTRTEQDQASAEGNRNGGAAITPVLTDNVDNTTAGLPTNVTVPANSVAQTQVGTIDPTRFDVVAVIRDFGDSPATYGTNTAFHTGTNSTLVLGTVQPDTETGPSTPVDGTGDDATGTDDEDSVSTFPTLTPTASQTYSVLVNATNTTGSDAYLVGYIDFNQDGDFGDTNEQSATVTVPSSATNPQGYLVTFTTPTGMTDGTTYARFRLSGIQSQVESPTGSATSGEIEDYALLISPNIRDYGDAPDVSSGTASGNYQTRFADSGPSHIVTTGLRLGSNIDVDDGTLQNNGASADDTTLTPDDEDGVSSLNTLQAVASQPYSVSVSVTNTTGSNTYLVGYIDFNRDGDFGDAGERSTTVTVATGGTTTQTLNFTTPANISSGTSYLRVRLGSVQAEVELSTGNAIAGEVEDYALTINPISVSTGPTFTCDNSLYIVTGSPTTPSILRQINRANSETAFTFVNDRQLPINPANYSINALAYNPIDNYIYGTIIGVVNTGGNSSVVVGSVVQIDSTGAVSFLGIPTQNAGDSTDGQTRSTFMAGNNQGFPAGTFLLDGTYVVMAEEGTGRTSAPIFLLDVTTSPPTYDYKGAVSGPFFDDFAVNPQDTTSGRVYGIDDNADRLLYFNAGSLGGSSAVSSSTNATSGTTGLNINYGSQFFDSFGRLLFRSATNPFSLYSLNETTGAATALLTGPTGGRHDGTSCNSVGLEKSVNPTTIPAGTTIDYTYRLANSRLTPITLTFQDDLRSVPNFPGTTLDESITPINGTFTGVFPTSPSSGTIQLTNSDRTLTVSSLTIPAQSTISFSAQVFVNAGIAIDPSGDPDGSQINSQTPYFNQAELTGLPSPLPSSILSDDTTNAGLTADPTKITVTPPLVTATPDLLLVKRITALVDSDGNVINYTSYRDDNNNPDFPDTTDDNDALWPGYNGGDGGNTFTVGELEINAAPGDRIEYTIYFLNTGNAPASNVQICDALDQYLGFENNTYTGASPTDGGLSSTLGFQLTLGSSSPNTVYLSSINDPPDRGQLVSQGNNPTGCVKDLAGTAMTTSDNVSGVVVVNLSSLDDSGNTNTVDTDDHYGFIRFRTIVK